MSMRRFWLGLAAVASTAALIGTACSATNAEDDAGTESGTASGGSTGSFNPSGTGGSGNVQECAGIENEAQFVGANAYIAVDRSGSMASDNKWPNTVTAFNTFFASPDADSLDVALRFWPEGSCNESTCDVNGCAQPNVPLGSLGDPAHEQALINAFNSMGPGGLTPMSAALTGAIQWATAQTQMGGEGSEPNVVIFLTDGIPTACDTNMGNIIQIAANAYNQLGILTFAVGLQGSNEADMHALAQAGGTNQAFIIGNGNAAQDLLDALKAIQQTVLACSFAMPESTDPNMPVDPNQVNITYTPGGGQPQTIPQVASAADCGAEGGWYYDDPQNPTTLHLCPATCEMVQADENGALKVVLGCATEVQ